MRWMYWVSVAALMSGLCDGAFAQSGCGCGNGAMANRPGYAAWCAEACCSPVGHALTPGCCEDRKPCCDNAWAGYCEHRAKVDAFWSRVGAPRGGRRAAMCCESGVVVGDSDQSKMMVEPTPAVPPAPTPAEKATQRIFFSRPVSR